MTRHDLLIDYNPWLRVYEGWCDDCSSPEWDGDQYVGHLLYYGKTKEDVRSEHDSYVYD